MKIISSSDPTALPHEIVDLNEWDKWKKRYRRSIEEAINPADYFEEVQEFIDLL